MAKNYEVIDRFGRLVERDPNEQLHDGDRLRVSLLMKDGMSPTRRAVAEDAEARRFPVVDAFGRPAGQRPGACYLRAAPDGTSERAAQIAREYIRQEAYSDSVRALEDAWRKPLAAPPIEPRADITGDGDATDDVPRTMSCRRAGDPRPRMAHEH